MAKKVNAKRVGVSRCSVPGCCCGGKQLFINLYDGNGNVFAVAPLVAEDAAGLARALLAVADEALAPIAARH